MPDKKKKRFLTVDELAAMENVTPWDKLPPADQEASRQYTRERLNEFYRRNPPHLRKALREAE